MAAAKITRPNLLSVRSSISKSPFLILVSSPLQDVDLTVVSKGSNLDLYAASVLKITPEVYKVFSA